MQGHTSQSLSSKSKGVEVSVSYESIFSEHDFSGKTETSQCLEIQAQGNIGRSAYYFASFSDSQGSGTQPAYLCSLSSPASASSLLEVRQFASHSQQNRRRWNWNRTEVPLSCDVSLSGDVRISSLGSLSIQISMVERLPPIEVD